MCNFYRVVVSKLLSFLFSLFCLFYLQIRGKKLEETLELHDFLSEYEDLEGWINKQKQVASSEDYGPDYDHVLVSYNANGSKDFQNMLQWYKIYYMTVQEEWLHT